ncbi:MAG: hypothetical protein U1E66_10675 [Rhodospirillales bacterium]
MNKTPVLNSSIFAAHKVALPDGRVTTIDTVLAEARLARGRDVGRTFARLRAVPHVVIQHLAALFAPALGRTRHLTYLP